MSFGILPDFFQYFSGRDVNSKYEHSYRFKSFRLDVKERQLLDNNRPVPLSPKVFDVLVALVERSGHLVEKDELLKLVWADSFVEEVNVARSVHALRKVLGEHENGNKLIETVAKKGYRFVAKVTEVCEPDKRQSAAAVGSQNDVIEELLSANRLLPTADKPKPKTRIILFTVGFASAVFLLVLLSLTFRSDSVTNPNKFKSIAILPVQPLTAENRDVIYEYGIADALTLKLSSAKNLIVRPLSATRKYADITQDAIAAGKELKVDYVLASNYQIADGKIRVTSQLFNVATGQAEETYKSEKDVGSIFATQDSIAGEVGNIILARFSATESSPVAERGTTNEEAYRFYLLGKNLTMKRTVEDKRKAIEYLEQAVRLDPNFARGYAGLAFAYKDPEKAKVAVEKALELDNNLSEAYAVRGSINLFKVWGDFPQAEKDILRAIALDPNNDLAHWLCGLLRGYQGRFDEGIREIETALAISPVTVQYIHARARILYYARRYDEAIVQYKRVLATDEDFVSAQNQLWMSYEMNGDYAMAYEIFIKQREKDEHLEDYKKAYAAAGWQGMIRKHFELHQVNENDPETNFYSIARQCAMLGEKEQAFAYLNKAFEKGQYQMVFMYAEPRFDSLRDDPRFDELVRRVGLN